jgi:hypothetical protein
MKISNPTNTNLNRRRHHLWRARRICSFCTVALLAAPTAHGAEVLTATLGFETEGLDLDTATVTSTEIPSVADGTDIRIAYNALRTPGAVVVPSAAEGVELALISRVAFDGVTAEAVDAPFSANDTVVVRTATRALFKRGNASESSTGVTFNYASL